MSSSRRGGRQGAAPVAALTVARGRPSPGQARRASLRSPACPEPADGCPLAAALLCEGWGTDLGEGKEPGESLGT